MDPALLWGTHGSFHSAPTTPFDLPEDALTTPAEAVETHDEHASGQADPAPFSLLAGLVRLCRPRQWVKNLLVFVAPGAAGVLSHGSVFWHSVGAFGIFCVAASGTYFVNDAVDAESDRNHPSKRFRPVAAGVVPASLAVSIGVVMMVASAGLGQALAGWHLALVMAIYSLVNVAYSLEIKNEPVLDLAAVSAGFVLPRWPAASPPALPFPTGSSSWRHSDPCSS